MSYFRPQQAEYTGLRTTSKLLISTSTLSQKPGRVRTAGVPISVCLNGGVHPKRSCQNCHSEKTEWPWYSYVAPMSWMIENDVQRGRSHMNLSRWNGYNPEQQQEILSKMSVLVRNRAMPLPRYLLLHPGSKLSDAEIAYLYQWTRTERKRLKAATAEADSQFSGGKQSGGQD